MNVTLYLWVALGSALGGVLRVAVSEVVDRTAGLDFPWGTMVVNVAGSFAIGFLASVLPLDSRAELRTFAMAGVLGGFTTFSTFSLQTVALAQAGEWLRMVANAGGSITLCLLAAWAGTIAGMGVSALKGS